MEIINVKLTSQEKSLIDNYIINPRGIKYAYLVAGRIKYFCREFGYSTRSLNHIYKSYVSLSKRKHEKPMSESTFNNHVRRLKEIGLISVVKNERNKWVTYFHSFDDKVETNNSFNPTLVAPTMEEIGEEIVPCNLAENLDYDRVSSVKKSVLDTNIEKDIIDTKDIIRNLADSKFDTMETENLVEDLTQYANSIFSDISKDKEHFKGFGRGSQRLAKLKEIVLTTITEKAHTIQFNPIKWLKSVIKNACKDVVKFFKQKHYETVAKEVASKEDIELAMTPNSLYDLFDEEGLAIVRERCANVTIYKNGMYEYVEKVMRDVYEEFYEGKTKHYKKSNKVYSKPYNKRKSSHSAEAFAERGTWRSEEERKSVYAEIEQSSQQFLERYSTPTVEDIKEIEEPVVSDEIATHDEILDATIDVVFDFNISYSQIVQDFVDEQCVLASITKANVQSFVKDLLLNLRKELDPLGKQDMVDIEPLIATAENTSVEATNECAVTVEETSEEAIEEVEDNELGDDEEMVIINENPVTSDNNKDCGITDEELREINKAFNGTYFSVSEEDRIKYFNTIGSVEKVIQNLNGLKALNAPVIHVYSKIK